VGLVAAQILFDLATVFEGEFAKHFVCAGAVSFVDGLNFAGEAGKRFGVHLCAAGWALSRFYAVGVELYWGGLVDL